MSFRGGQGRLDGARRAGLVLAMIGWALLTAACQPAQAVPSLTPAVIPAATATLPPTQPEPSWTDVMIDLPVWGGAVWVYSYAEYQPAPNDPTQVITATYVFTETVVETYMSGPYFVSHVQHQESPVAVPANWTGTRANQPADWWYVFTGRQVYESFRPIAAGQIETTTMTLAYELPLTLGKSWCPIRILKGQPVTDCTAAGQRTVVSQGRYATPAGQFDQCSQITEAYNSGGVTRWLCRGIGVVAQKYDHSGTRFGFYQALISSRPGSF